MEDIVSEQENIEEPNFELRACNSSATNGPEN